MSRSPTVEDQFFFASKQIERELSVTPKTDYMITDSPVFLAYIYASLSDLRYNVLEESKRNADFLSELLRLAIAHLNYNNIFYLTPFREARDDGVRPAQQREQIKTIDRRIKEFLDSYAYHYYTIDEPFDLQGRKEYMLECIKYEI